MYKKNLLLTVLSLLFFANANIFGQDTNNDYVLGNAAAGCFRVDDNAALDVTGDFTVEAWVYITENLGSSCFIIDRASNWQFYIISSSVRFDLQGGDLITTGVISQNEWHHVAVVREGTRTLIFTDGVKGQGENLALTAGTTPCVVGGQDSWFSGTPSSLFDEVRFSNTSICDTTGFTPSADAPLGTDANTVFYFQFENNTEFPPLDDGPLSLATSNGQTDGTNTISSSNYASAPAGLPLPVELISFSALGSNRAITLSWQTATEINNYGFEIQRSDEEVQWSAIGFVEGYGNSSSPKEYTFTDNSVNAGSYYYRLKQVDNDGSFEYSNSVSASAGVPENFELSQNYPNPFNPTTTIDFRLPETTNIALKVFNTVGEEVATLIDGNKEAGFHQVSFDASNLPSGLYIYRIESMGFSQSMKMLLVK